MPIETRLSDENRTLTVSVKGRFDFSQVNDFRLSYESHRQCQNFIIDLKHTDHLDSSALGMLLNMRSFLGDGQASIQIVNCSPAVRKIFEISRFDKKFILG